METSLLCWDFPKGRNPLHSVEFGCSVCVKAIFYVSFFFSFRTIKFVINASGNIESQIKL